MSDNTTSSSIRIEAFDQRGAASADLLLLVEAPDNTASTSSPSDDQPEDEEEEDEESKESPAVVVVVEAAEDMISTSNGSNHHVSPQQNLMNDQVSSRPLPGQDAITATSPSSVSSETTTDATSSSPQVQPAIPTTTTTPTNTTTSTPPQTTTQHRFSMMTESSASGGSSKSFTTRRVGGASAGASASASGGGKPRTTSMELRKIAAVAMDTSLFSSSGDSNLSRDNNNNNNTNSQHGTATVNSSSAASSTPRRQLPSSTTNSNHSFASSSVNSGSFDQCAMIVLDASDSTHDLEADEDDDDHHNLQNNSKKNKTTGDFDKSSKECLRSTCLRSNFTLQTQLLLSFGLVSAATLLVVLAICIAVSVLAGANVRDLAGDSLQGLSYRVQGTTVRYLAETLSQRLLPEDMIQIFHDATMDRLIGYPDFPGYDEDNLTPFRDSVSQTRRYPIQGPLAVLDWDLETVVTPDTAQEHVGDRYPMYRSYANITTSHAAYSFQGVCNPQALPGHHDYYPNCTTENNNLNTGGVIHPTTTNRLLHRKSSDLTPLLKALHEQNLGIRDLGICFANDGAGSTLMFPGYPTNHTQSYISGGCDWMNQPNPYNPSEPIGTPEMIARCHPEGTIVYNRDYNPLERPWCIDQALNPNSTRYVGPFVDAWNPEHMLMLVGKALYDPLTHAFVGCLFVDYTIGFAQDMLLHDDLVSQNSHISITLFNPELTVAVSSAWETSHETALMSDLKIGVTPDLSQQIYDLVDYDSEWDPEQVRDAYAKFIELNEEEGYLVGVHPMPPVPQTYNPQYKPQFMAILSVYTQNVFDPVQRMSDIVDEKVERLVYISLVAAAIGFGVVMVLIIVVSKSLTFPLKRMHHTAHAIVQNFGGNSEQGIQYAASKQNALVQRCTPDTEVMDVVREFQKMVQKFAGTCSMAKAVQVRFTELANHFSFTEEFRDLYRRRLRDDAFPYRYNERNVSKSKTTAKPKHHQYASKGHLSRGSVHSESRRKKELNRIHFGSILTGSQSHLRPATRTSTPTDNFLGKSQPKRKRLTSPLFLWIVLWIVSPLLITSVTLSAVVTFYVSEEFTAIIDDGKTKYLDMEKFALQATVKLRAEWIAAATERSLRDLHLITRYSSWLLFGGLERSDSFTVMTSGANECKDFEEAPLQCPYLEDFPCDCSWDAKYGTCYDNLHDSGSYNFRYQQETYFICESHDTMPDGDRYSSLSFPNVSYSPSTTEWWQDLNSVPGAEKGSNSSGYDTTYDRLRVLSAVPVFQTLYNYDFERNTALQSAVAMEADGMVVGYHGCALTGQSMAAFWESSTKNRASELRPALCPVGKFGYDARCREWYHTGRHLAATNNTHLYVSSPYTFATDNTLGQTCTSPLIDPESGEHVGQAFVDFKPESVARALDTDNTMLAEGGYPILIASRTGEYVADTIVGPNFELGEDPLPIEDLVLPHDWGCLDDSCQRHQAEFGEVLKRMREGEHASSNFTAGNARGSEELMFVAFAPVATRSYRPLNSSDFARGVEMESNYIYFLALTQREQSLVTQFEKVENDIHRTINIGVGILCITILIAMAVVVYISYWVASSITEPMQYLLELTRHINQLDEDAINVGFNSQAGSREVKSVAHTMRTLHKIVFCANSAYFAGDIEKAFAVLTDSARLFKRLDNKKAVGIANNNLGNTMLAMYRTMTDAGMDTFCGLTRREIVQKGMAYFHEAIRLGEKAYDDFHEAEGWSPNCLDFMQHLSNRYFNRAMFLLTVKDDHENPEELKELGMRDLQIARDMDVEITDQGTEVGWNVNTVDKAFSVALNRARGHLRLLEMGYSDEWDIEELLEQSFKSLQYELKQISSDLFIELNAPGRMQQIETELIRYKLWKGDLECASKIAIRMLIEDEYTLPEAQLKAVEALISLVKNDESKKHIKDQLEQYFAWLLRAKAQCDTSRLEDDETAVDEEVSQVVQMSMARLQVSVVSEASYEDPTKPKQSSLLATTCGDVTMEIF